MKTKLLKRSLLALSGVGLLGLSGLWAWHKGPNLLDNTPFSQWLEAQFSQQHLEKGREKIYAHLDKTFVKPGEDLWIAVYIRDAQTLMPAGSEVVYIELLDPKGSAVVKQTITAQGGKAPSVVNIPERAKGGLYKLRCYTKHSEKTAEVFERDIQVQVPVLPNLNMRLDFDRKAYGPGDEVLAWLDLNTLENKALADYSFNAQISIEGKQVESLIGKTDDLGRAAVRFKLPAKLSSNDGLLNILLTYKGLNESISRSIPIVLGDIDLQFFPEGGQLLAGHNNGLAFKALNEFGKPADVSGEILDARGVVVANFDTYHQGMGAIDFLPQTGMRYTARIVQPVGIDKLYSIPSAKSQGHALRVKAEAKDLAVTVYSSAAEKAHLVVHGREKLLYSQALELKRGENQLRIPAQDFPIGITQVTLFDDSRNPLAERLVFAGADKQLQVKISTPKERYLPREEVVATIEIKDEQGRPVNGNFSMSVVDEKLLSYADDRQGHILSHVLLESDLKGRIEEPNFYFDRADDPTRLKPEIKRPLALDHLLLSQGWRSFSWQAIREAGDKGLKAPSKEQAHFKGKITDAQGKAIAKANVEMGKIKAQSDEAGNFELHAPLDKDSELLFSAAGYAGKRIRVSEYQSNLQLVLNKKPQLAGSALTQYGGVIPEIEVYAGNKKIQTLKNLSAGKFSFEIEANVKELEFRPIQGYGSPMKVSLTPNEDQNFDLRFPYTVVVDQVSRTGTRPTRAVRPTGKGAAAGAVRPEARPRPQPAPVPNDNGPVLDDEMFMGVVAEPSVGMSLNAEIATSASEKEVVEQKKSAQPAKEAEEEVLIMDKIEEQKAFDDEPMNKPKPSPPAGAPLPSNRRQQDVPMPPPAQATLTKHQWLVSAEGKPYSCASNCAKASRYTLVREFYAPKYEPLKKNTVREDFRNTIYWNPSVEVKNGKAELRFRTSDALTQFRISLEGFGQEGQIGRQEFKIFSQKPLEMIVKVPVEVLTGDKVFIPLTLSNNTAEAVEGKLEVKLPENLDWVTKPQATVAIAPRSARTVLLQCQARNQMGKGEMAISFRDGQTRDQFQSEIRSRPRGFPVKSIYKGEGLSERFNVRVENPVQGTMKALIRIHPSTLNEVMGDLSSMMRMPSGCFEQTSSSNYPNILVLDYLRATKSSKPDIEQRAKGFLETGYQRLTGYESPGGGFDWWGRAPAHEALTAYGIMQFKDMSAVHKVDQGLIDRAAKWLMTRKDGKGGWLKNPNAAHSWAKAEVTDAYIVWSLCEAGFAKDIKPELEKSYADAVKSEDPYMMALLANALLAIGDARAEDLLKDLSKRQDKEGSFRGLSSSVVMSTGQNLHIETTGLTALAMIRSKKYRANVDKALVWLRGKKDYYGYGTTQGTVFALKAFLLHAQAGQRAPENGKLAIFVDGERKAELSYKADDKEIIYPNLHELLKGGSQVVELKYEGVKEPLPFEIELSYATSQPPNSPEAVIQLETKAGASSLQTGETLRLTATLSNISDKGQAMTMAMIGIPAGLSLQPWQLKELQEKKVFDYYEIFDGYLVLHYEQMKPKEQRTVNLDLKADIPGEYEAPASSAFLYYKQQHRHWASPAKVTVR